MGLKPSCALCCSPEQHSVNLNISTETTFKQILDDDQIVYSAVRDSLSLNIENIGVLIKPYTNVLQLNINETVEWPCLIQLTPPSQTSRQGLDLVFVIELSSEIKPLWLNSIKKCLHYCLNSLNKHDRVSIVGFNNIATKLSPLTAVTKANMQQI